MEDAGSPVADGRRRLGLDVRGAVQGVGFRPFVYRLAGELGLDGWVRNDARGVRIEIEGPWDALERFAHRLEAELPPLASIHALARTTLDPTGARGFRIDVSASGAAPTAVVLADTAPCADCTREMNDPGDRRHRYPFINCTNCGPRFSIVTGLPYDRAQTTMQRFAMCAECQAEYDDPLDRRFHAQPNACPACGPSLHFSGAHGRPEEEGDAALQAAAARVRNGEIVAFKGVGGFLLVCDAADESAVRRLRERKHRDAKPLAVLVSDVAMARRLCLVPSVAADRLASAEAPILLLARRADAPLAPAVAPGLETLGVMLPSSPLHHLFMEAVARPVVATSGNRSNEPIAIDDDEARVRLGKIADAFLGHDRPIARHVDDSVGWVLPDGPAVIRRARGHAPLPVRTREANPCILAVGGHLKNTIALAIDDQVFVSQHIGDLDTVEARGAFEDVIVDFLAMYRATPVAVAHDLHPDYGPTRWVEALAERRDAAWAAGLAALPRIAVQHHHAHLAACLAEHGRSERALGITWDGTGYGGDGTVWGGEVLLGNAASAQRVAHLHPFLLPGADAAVHEPRRVAAALLFELGGADALDALPEGLFQEPERRVLIRLLASGFQAPSTTSAGRLFDGIAGLLGLFPTAAFEGQAAMALEAEAQRARGRPGAYELPLRQDTEGTGRLDWRPLLEALLEDQRRGTEIATIAARFHGALVEGMLTVATKIGEPLVALSGGCFQNRILLEGAVRRLGQAGFEVLHHVAVPTGDGCIALGQVAVAAAQWEE